LVFGVELVLTVAMSKVWGVLAIVTADSHPSVCNGLAAQQYIHQVNKRQILL